MCTSACVTDPSGFLAPAVEPVAFQMPTPLATPTTAQDVPLAAPGLATGFTAEGFPYMGSATAPIVVIEYSDFHCPYCQRHNQETLPLYLDHFVHTGLVQYVVKDLPLEELHPQARMAHRAAWCVALQDTDAFWWMHSQLYATQAQHARTPDTLAFFDALVLTYNEMRSEGQGLDMQAFSACQQNRHNEVDARIDRAMADAQQLGITGTPTFFFYYREEPDNALRISGTYEYEVFADVTHHLDQYLAEMAKEAVEPQVELPFWVSAEGLMPARLWRTVLHAEDDIDHPHWEGVTRAGDYFKGSPAAPVVVFEFSDFQCPYCQQHQVMAQPTLDEAYVDKGQVMWVYKHFPLMTLHAYAAQAAEAALCAGEQGHFGTLHTWLFTHMDTWAHADYRAAFQAYGQQLAATAPVDRIEVQVPQSLTAVPPEDWVSTLLLPFDPDLFMACLDDNEYRPTIVQSMQDVSGVVQGTPTFLIWHRRYGLLTQPLTGSLPVEQFIGLFDQIFAQLAELEGRDS